jgi:hypothetical protein
MAFFELGWLTVKKFTQLQKSALLLSFFLLLTQQYILSTLLQTNILLVNQTTVIAENSVKVLEEFSGQLQEIAAATSKTENNIEEFQQRYESHWPRLDPDKKDEEYVSRELFNEFKDNYARRWLAEPEGEYVTSLKFIEKMDQIVALLEVPLIEKLNAQVVTMEFPSCQTAAWDGIGCEYDPLGIGPINCNPVTYEETSCEKPVFIGV